MDEGLAVLILLFLFGVPIIAYSIRRSIRRSIGTSSAVSSAQIENERAQEMLRSMNVTNNLVPENVSAVLVGDGLNLIGYNRDSFKKAKFIYLHEMLDEDLINEYSIIQQNFSGNSEEELPRRVYLFRSGNVELHLQCTSSHSGKKFKLPICFDGKQMQLIYIDKNKNLNINNVKENQRYALS